MIRVYADPKCKACHGSGTVYDLVPMPFGVGNCRMPSECECWQNSATDGQMAAIENGEKYEVQPQEGAKP